MNQIILIIIFISFLTYSCDNKSKKTTDQMLNTLSDKTMDNKFLDSNLNQSNNTSVEFSKVFSTAVKAFPQDSASLYKFYYQWQSTSDNEKIKGQIKKLKILTSEESIDKYYKVQENLKPLLTNIIRANSITKLQADSLMTLYSDYDYFSGEALFSKFLKDDENYNLVWKAIQTISKESQKDTFCIHTLIHLDKNIKTNVELAESMSDFITEAIENNPIGFLKMYNIRNNESRTDLVNYLTIYDGPNKKLIQLFTNISKNSKNPDLRNSANDLLKRIEG